MDAPIALIPMLILLKWLYDLTKWWVVWDMRRCISRGEVEPELGEAFIAVYRHNDYVQMRKLVRQFVERKVAEAQQRAGHGPGIHGPGDGTASPWRNEEMPSQDMKKDGPQAPSLFAPRTILSW